MRVVLFALNGSWSHSNLAIRCLREPLEKEGFEVVLCERSLRDRTSHILEELYAAKGDVYGFSCYIWNLPQMLHLSRSLHGILPQAKLLLGGPEVSYATERFEKMEHLAGIIRGEGEEALPWVCKQIRDGKAFDFVTDGGCPRVMLDEGIHYRSGEQTGDLLYYESSRGCPYSCAYCLSSATTGLRMKSVEQTLADLRAFEQLSGACRVIKFVDRTFNADPRRANAVWRALLGEEYTKCYHFEICASLLNEESFEILSRFPRGKVQLEIGLQSTNPQTLREVSRHIDPTAVIKAVHRLHERGNLHVHLDLIAGLPYEGYARFAQSFDEAYGCCEMLQLGFLKLLYGTKLRENAEQYGYVCDSEPPYTVLQSKWMSYAELQLLTHIAEVRERFDESGKFAHALSYVMPRVSSPFGFWEGLTVYLSERDSRPLQRISQPDAYRYFAEFARKNDPDLDQALLFKLLCVDFTAHEHKNPPRFLTVAGEL